jgi:hypothetical protein
VTSADRLQHDEPDNFPEVNHAKPDSTNQAIAGENRKRSPPASSERQHERQSLPREQKSESIAGEMMELTEEQLEVIRREVREQVSREEFVRGYVAACREWTSGCVPAVTLAYKAYERVKR